MNNISTLVKIADLVICVAYVLGALAILFPGSSAIPTNMGGVAIGTLLIMCGLFGRPYPNASDLEPVSSDDGESK